MLVDPIADLLVWLGHLSDVLEIGVGTGRLARRVLDMGCRTFTGLDISAKTLERARVNLAPYPYVRLVLGDDEEFRFSERFDVA